MSRFLTKSEVFHILAVVTIIACANQVLGSPTIPINFTVQGKIVDVSWYPKKLKHKGIEGMSGTLGVDFWLPPRYEITMSDCRFIAHDEFSRQHVEKLQKNPQVSLTITHEKDDGYLRAGMQIKIVNYQIMGDEGGNWYSYKDIHVIETTAWDQEQTLILNALEKLFLKGLQTRDFDLIRAICLPKTKLIETRQAGRLRVISLDQWSKRFDPMHPPFNKLQHKVAKIDYVGTAAQVRIDFVIDDKTKITDFLNLVEIDGTWKIVNIIGY